MTTVEPSTAQERVKILMSTIEYLETEHKLSLSHSHRRSLNDLLVGARYVYIFAQEYREACVVAASFGFNPMGLGVFLLTSDEKVHRMLTGKTFSPENDVVLWGRPPDFHETTWRSLRMHGFANLTVPEDAT